MNVILICNIVGTALGGWVIGWAMGCVGYMPRPVAPWFVAFMTLVAITCVAMVGHGVWFAAWYPVSP